MNIWVAAADGDLEKVRQFLEDGVDPNARDQNGYTPVHAAAEYGHLELMELLIQRGGDPNITDLDGDTPLHAVEIAPVAKLLVALGADPNILNKDGLSPLAKAQQENDFPELISLLEEFSGNASGTPKPEGVEVSVRSETEEHFLNHVPESQRTRLQEIIEHGNEKDFNNFLKDVVGSNAEDSVKKVKIV